MWVVEFLVKNKWLGEHLVVLKQWLTSISKIKIQTIQNRGTQNKIWQQCPFPETGWEWSFRGGVAPADQGWVRWTLSALRSFASAVLPVVEQTLGVHSAGFLHSFSKKFGHLKENAKNVSNLQEMKGNAGWIGSRNTRICSGFSNGCGEKDVMLFLQRLPRVSDSPTPRKD